MRSLRYTLLADGPSDRCLLRIIDWLLVSTPRLSSLAVTSQFADPRHQIERRDTLAGRIAVAIEQYPCDVLFVHRDAEREPLSSRVREVEDALTRAQVDFGIPVVPVRMTEAWLLLEPDAIRRAADKPNGRVPLELPRVADLEGRSDPKGLLDELLIAASETTGRRLARFRRELAWRRSLVAAGIRDYTPLLRLPAFCRFQASTLLAIDRWCENPSGV